MIGILISRGGGMKIYFEVYPHLQQPKYDVTIP